MHNDFYIVNDKNLYIDLKKENNKKVNKLKEFPIISTIILTIIIIGCLSCNIISKYDPKYMDLTKCNIAPNSTFFFGTDSMGKDIFSQIWYGGKISLFIGAFSTIIATFIGVIYGYISGMSSKHVDYIMMRAIDIIISVPSILIVIFMQVIIGKNNAIGISIAIGMVSWMNISKVVRSEVKQIRNADYISEAKILGGGYIYILRQHLLPNFISSIMFMIVSNIGSAIAIESTLSFLGIGLPVETVSWGSMLSLSQQALLSNYWWIIIIPGLFLVVTLICLANIGDYLRKKNIKKYNNL
ncbi:ABC transporter permease [Clostridium sp.]|uniref:ABC transporter permease n=1 Tax=Clostridium sp. TaxID=1506 RepID=UPI0026054D7C